MADAILRNLASMLRERACAELSLLDLADLSQAPADNGVRLLVHADERHRLERLIECGIVEQIEALPEGFAAKITRFGAGFIAACRVLSGRSE